MEQNGFLFFQGVGGRLLLLEWGASDEHHVYFIAYSMMNEWFDEPQANLGFANIAM